MAEFKLGRIRFVWKNQWSTGTTYFQDDVVAFGGRIYICVIGHTASADFFTDLDISPTRWNLVSDGQTWKGDWQPQTRYVYNDIVKYGAKLYICQTIHVSAADSTTGLEADIANWQTFAEGLDWKGDWSTSFDYKENDFVKYGGTTYVCVTPHISAATETLGLENDLSNWEIFNQGIEYKGTWTGTTRYKLNDVVRYGAGVYICNEFHTSGSAFADNSDKFDKFVDGFQYEDEWVYTGQYQPGDVVRYGGNQYIAKTSNSDSIPPSNTDDWDLFSHGLVFLGDWGEDSSSFEYKIGQVVRLGGYTYRCILDHQDQQPPNATYWERLNSGFDWRGEWLDDQEYFLGDVVRYGDNSYVCVQGHISEGDDFSTETAVEPGGGAENSRPDLDTNGVYWNVIAIGSEASVLTTEGDLVYYSGAAPTRLPIGTNGQVLTVAPEGIPEWATLGTSNDVYYVAEHGVDSPYPEYGASIDRPFRSIRYAATQAERGAKNKNAARLLELNRRFIQREIVEWTDAQITAGTSPFTTDFSYESSKCERDMGLIIDALIWDLTHGGNVRSREAALSYVNDTVGSPYLTQKEQTVASINYGLTVIEDVLNQTSPDVNYQSTNGDNSTAIVEQYFETGIAAEADTVSRSAELIGIITDAITAGVADDIPARDIKTILIKVATGKYYETLPIIVPAECCIMGDELRAVNVQPRKESNSNLTLRSDFRYSFQAIDRIRQIVDDIVTGVAITPTTGNTLTQDQSWPYAETAIVGPAVEKLARNIKRRTDALLGDKLEANLTPAYNMDTPINGYHRDLLIQNKDFIKAEIVAYLANPDYGFENVKYSKTKCKQDVGFIIDALAYDLTYGGNWQSVLAGEAYFNGRTGDLQISASEKAATLSAYGYLKSLVQTVGRGIAVSPSEQTSVEQIEGTLGGDVSSAAIVANNIDDIIDIITNGIGTVDITYPDVSGASSNLLFARTKLYEALPTVQENTIDFISKNFGSFKYDSAKCRRDLNLIITDTSYDVALGTNFNAVYTGIAYQRASSYTVLNSQLTETVGAIRYARDLLQETVTTDGSSASGSSNSSTRIATAFDEIVDIIRNGTLSVTAPNDGVAAALTFPSPVGVDQNRVDAKDNLIANRDFIIEDVIAYITNTYGGGFVYDATKCRRDVGYIVDSLCYDILYGGTQATTRVAQSYFVDGVSQLGASEATETAAAYAHLKTVVRAVVTEDGTYTKQSGNLETQTTLGTPATGTEATELDTDIDIIRGVIIAGNTDSLADAVYPSVTWADAEYQTAFSNIASDKNDVIVNTIQYINTTYNDFNYDQAKCQRDIAIIAEAAAYDWLLDTNYASIVAALSYLRLPSAKILGNQKAATLAANEYAKQQLLTAVTDATAQAQINETWEWVEDIVWSGSPEGSNTQTTDIEVYNAVRQLELNKEFIVQEALNYVDEYFKDTVTSVDLDTNELTISSTAWLFPGQGIKFAIGDDSTDIVTDAGLDTTTTYYVRNITGSTTFTIGSTPFGDPLDPDIDLTEYSDGGFVVQKAYEYNTTACARDVREYIDAIKWDMIWPQEWSRSYTDNITLNLPAFYKTSLAARYYVNSIIGSQEEDFFYLRNGTGLRLMTLDGLQGDLGPENAYGTSRPTAGAYASLDPGWGPDDERVWISARSPYVQNVTTFGYAATGQRIDGALHNGGNDSIVSNDFTQVISDGIGAHILNNGRAELVSVFTYYAHIGYLAETGGRIRATNGNNSYGDFGSVAEGVDPEETPVTAIVDNRTQYRATVATIFTDADKLLQVEWSHAGNEYTEAVLNIFGAGTDEEVVVDEFRDKAVFQARIIEVDDSTGNPDATAGGSGYTVVSNTAQAGSSSSITLAATDGNLSSAYPGMKIYVTAGAGAGLFGIIDTYNSGTKIATVIKETDGTSGWDHVVPGTTFEAPNSSSTYQVEPRISFTAPTKSDTLETSQSGQWVVSGYLEQSDQYFNVASTSSSDGTGATFDVTKNGEKYYVTLNAGGANYTRLDTLTIAGTLLDGASPLNDITITATTVNSSTGAVIDFDFTGYGQKGVFVAFPASGLGSQYSIDGETWTTMNSSASAGQWKDVVSGKLDDGTTTFTQSAHVLAGTNGTNLLLGRSFNGTSWGALSGVSGIGATSTASCAFGQIDTAISRFIAIGDNDRDIVYSDNVFTWTTEANALPSTGYTHVTFGAGKFVAIKAGSQEMSYSTDGLTWTTEATGMPNTNNWSKVVWGNGRFVAIASDSTTVAYSLDGISWTAVASAVTGNPNDIAYGQGVFVIGTPTTTGVYYSEDGIYWQTYTASNTITNGATALTFGSPDRDPTFIAFQNAGLGGTTAAHNLKIGATAKGRASVANEQIFEIRITEPGSGYTSAPTITVTDPNNINDVLITVRTGTGAIAQPTFVNRGTGFITASADIEAVGSNGFADFFQDGSFVAVRRLTSRPVNGSNIEFESLPGQFFKLVSTVSFLGTNDGSYTAFLQISPSMEIEDTPNDGDPVELRIRFSQVRLTGHDFLDIGTGNFDETNYPGEPTQVPNQDRETTDSDGGRVFYTSTDQDGNFRVGDLFSIEQATGVANLNAEAFNIAGLQELTLGEVTLGGNSAAVNEFSTDPFFTANSDSVVPTQRAVKAYIEAQIGGGGASLNVNSVTAGDIFINTNQITTVSGETINIKANVNFEGTVLGLPLAYNYYFR
jgi:hypothetical protein